ncbi:MAG TPA: ATP-binding protein [Mucilaginibacter sp.]|jgi:signal transduction histidine kinase
MTKKNNPDIDLMRLRAAAELLLMARDNNPQSWEKGLDEIFQELQIHQIELELQNEQLSATNEDLEWQRLRFTNIYELAPIGYFIVSKSGMVEEVNAAAVELLETGRKNIVGQLFRYFLDSEYSDTFYLFFHRILSSKIKEGCTLKMVSHARRTFNARLEGIYVPGTDQCFLAVLDISEIIEIRGKLAESNERLQLAIEASRAGTWELDPQTMLFKLDSQGYGLCRINEATFGGNYHSFLSYVHPNDRTVVDDQFRAAFNHSKKLELVCRLGVGDDEPCYAALRGHMLPRGDGREMLVGIIMDYTEKKRLEAEAEQSQKQHQKEINAAVLLAEENERKRMSEVLHDSVAQLLYGVKLQFSQLQRGEAGALQQVNELLDTAIRETRNLSFELSPAILVDLGLKDTIEELASRLSMPNFQVSTEIKGFKKRLGLTLETYIFRIVQELINNCMKHARASIVQINIAKNEGVTIEVIDNGIGFNPSQLNQKSAGAGFSSIRNRISVYNGSLHIDSKPGKGTRVIVQLAL